MNVKRKVQLMNEYDSYWDMLPQEMQEYIVQFKRSQENIEEHQKDLMTSLHHEIQLYEQLKARWGLGHIRCKVIRCHCKKHFGLIISGYYINEENVKRKIYLGHGFQQALSRVNHVKSFL